MKTKIYYSKILNQHFRYVDGGIICEDKVIYTNEEIIVIKKSGLDVKLIHDVKLLFDGQILSQEQFENLQKEYQKGPSDFEQAVDYASKLIKDGLNAREAIHRAASNYHVSISAVARQLGKRSNHG